MRTKIFLMLAIVALACLFSGCKKSSEELENKPLEMISDNGGVIVKGYNSEGYIHNTNDFPVRVKKAMIRLENGEIAMWIKKFEPGERVEQYIKSGWPYSGGEGFYVYDMNGVLIGFIVPTKQ